MRAAVVDSTGLVVNVIVTEGRADEVAGCTLIESDSANIGDRYKDGKFVPVVEETSSPTTPIEVLWAEWAKNG